MRYEITSDDARGPDGRPRTKMWNEVADLLRLGNTLFIENISRQAIYSALALTRRMDGVRIHKSGEGFVVWLV